MEQRLSEENEVILSLFVITASCIGAILSTIYSLTHGILAVFPFLYLLPIILVVYLYPRRAVIFSVGISVTYIGIVYLLAGSSPTTIATSTAWFAIFITIGVVTGSYANELEEERTRMHHILDNSLDGIICFDPRDKTIREINAKCARWLSYDRNDLEGSGINRIWPDEQDFERFLSEVKKGVQERETEVLFQAKDKSLLRFIVSPILVTREHIICSVTGFAGSKGADEEIQKALDDLEEQVSARTAGLERINEELRAELFRMRQSDRLETIAKMVQEDHIPDENK